MSRSVKQLEHFRFRTVDGNVGRITDMYFDDERWIVRYLVASSGAWLGRRGILVAPSAVTSVDWASRIVGLNLTRAQIENGPSVAKYWRYYGYPEYWPYTAHWVWGAMPTVSVHPDAQAEMLGVPQAAQRSDRDPDESHLLSCREVIGYRIEASDEPIGHVVDFLFDVESWAIPHVVVDTRSWLPHKRVLIPIESIRGVSGVDRSLRVDMRRDEIQRSPAYHYVSGLSGDSEKAARNRSRGATLQ